MKAMQYQVLIQKPFEQHFVASIMGLSNVVASGETEEEAIVNVKSVLAEKMAKTKIVTIEVEPDEKFAATSTKTEDPFLKHIGVFKDDPTFDDFLEEIEKYRKQVDEETNAWGSTS